MFESIYILSLPVEIIILIIEDLPKADLWNLYNGCQTLRAYSAPYLFRTVRIRFSGAIPVLLNSRQFPFPQNRLLRILAKWAVHVREMDVWGDEESIQLEFLNLLPHLENLTTFSVSYPPSATAFQMLLVQLATMPSLRTMNVDFMSPKTWALPMSFRSLRNLYLSCIGHEPGISVLPALPALETLALNFWCYCLDCPRNGQEPCTMLQLDQLPRLLALSISGAQEGNIICGGISPQLRELEISFSRGFSLNMILASLGPSLEEVYICECEFPLEKPLSGQPYPAMRRLSILNSASGLAAFVSFELPPTLRLVMRIKGDDFEHLRGWPQVVKFFRSHAVELSLSGPVDTEGLLGQTCRLLEVMSLPSVRRDGPNWPQPSNVQPGD
ncbi:hypothetical protein BJX63DRAFT_416307 [Aspergillus granulosus]|uniref:F-box domain-containing protein n=1 Tax=Aspergillus granulosus TaxID=176169 RepID=A0ABR4GS43_9EURO